MASMIEGLDQPLDALQRDEVYKDIIVGSIKGYLHSGKGRKLRLMVVGEAGQGKSTLINALVGQEVATEGGSFDPCTSDIHEYLLTQNGVNMGIWDTPGFGVESEEEDEKVIEELKKSDCHPVDLALFCIRFDSTRIPNRVHTETVKKLTEVFGKGFWKHCLFVLTFANNVQQLCPKGDQLEEFFSQRLIAIEDQLRKVLKKHVNLPSKELDRVRVVPVGSSREGQYRQSPWALPDREDWFLGFWMDVAEHMNPEALSTLLQANYHRLEAPYPDGQISFCPDLPDVEPHERLIEASPREISTVKQQMKDGEEITEESLTIGSSSISREEVRYLGAGSKPFPNSKEERQPRSRPNNTVNTVAGDVPTETTPIQHRKIPIHEILKRELERENSGFLSYLKEFAKKRGEELKLIGHLGGLLEGALVYFSHK